VRDDRHQRYYRTENWQLKTEPGGGPFLQNQSGGRIILDETVARLLESIDGNTFDEIDHRKIVSSALLETFLTVFSRVGVLRTGEGSGRGIDKETVEPAAASPLPPLKENPLVSVIIVNYNGERHLPGLLESLKRQVYTHFEIIIVDNRSTDNSCEWVRANYPDVRLEAQPRNTGFAAGVNTGIGCARGEYILVLNNDILVDARALYELVNAALSAKGPWSAAAPKMKFYDNPAFINAVGNSMYSMSWGSDNFIGYVDLGRFDHIKEAFSACFGAVLLNREALKEIGLLDTRYRFYYEDMDWSFRARAYGFPIITAPRAEIYHKFGASMSLKSQSFKFRYIVGNRLYFTLKNLEWATMKRFLINYLIEDIKSMLIFLKRRNISLYFAYIRGYMRFLASLPALMFKRARMRKRRKSAGIEDSQLFAGAVPLNLTLMERGAPKLDIYSLRTNYAPVAPPGSEDDLIIWRLRPPRKDKNAAEKIYMEFGFHLPEPGNYDIHLLGLIRKPLTVYLDNRPLPPTGIGNSDNTGGDKKSKRIELNFSAIHNIFIPGGSHILELERRNHVHAVVLRKSCEKEQDVV
jgi:GT2 family glycosyltransferase